MAKTLTDADYMRLALRLARRGFGLTSPNPMVGAVLVEDRQIIGRGWHHRAGAPHAEIEALNDAAQKKHPARGATLYVTLEPCSTYGRTPPCARALIAARVRRVVVGAIDPNPRHRGRGLRLLRRAGITLIHGVLGDECSGLNESFNHWIVHHTPFVTVKAAMTLDGKIATATGESKWITGEKARAFGMGLRQGADAILVGINTILADDPSLTLRGQKGSDVLLSKKRLRRIILDSQARTPLNARVVCDDHAQLTSIVVSRKAPSSRVRALAKRVDVVVAPLARIRPAVSGPPSRPAIDLRWLMHKLGSQGVTSLLVEGGGEVNASFILSGLAHRVAFFYAPKILGGRDARRAVAGDGAKSLDEIVDLANVQWRRLFPDWLLTAECSNKDSKGHH